MPELKTEEEISSALKKLERMAKTAVSPYSYQVHITKINHINGMIKIWKHNKRYQSEIGAKIAAGKMRKKIYSSNNILIEEVITRIL